MAAAVGTCNLIALLVAAKPDTCNSCQDFWDGIFWGPRRLGDHISIPTSFPLSLQAGER